jgi:hypothetical protein
MVVTFAVLRVVTQIFYFVKDKMDVTVGLFKRPMSRRYKAKFSRGLL